MGCAPAGHSFQATAPTSQPFTTQPPLTAAWHPTPHPFAAFAAPAHKGIESGQVESRISATVDFMSFLPHAHARSRLTRDFSNEVRGGEFRENGKAPAVVNQRGLPRVDVARLWRAARGAPQLSLHEPIISV